MKKINQYSVDGIHNSLYYHFVKEWKGLTKVKGKDSNKGFSDLIKDIVSQSNAISENMFEADVVRYSERLVKNRKIRLSEYNARSKDSKILDQFSKKLKTASNMHRDVNFIKMRNSIKSEIMNEYDDLSALEPKMFNTVCDSNLNQCLAEMNKSKSRRFDDFNGLPYKMKNQLHFIDRTSAPICYYFQSKNGHSVLDTFIDSIISYTVRVNEVKNTKKIIKKINKADEEGVKDPTLFDNLIPISTSKQKVVVNNHNAQINTFLSKNKKNQS